MNRAEENNDLYGQSPKGENIMFKKKLIAAGMTAFAITTMAGITALASQEFGNQNMPVRNMQNQNFGESFDKGFERGGLFNSGNIGQGMMSNGAFDESNIPSDMPQNKDKTEGLNDFENSLSDTDNDQSGKRPASGGVDNQSTERPAFGETDNQSGERLAFEGGNNQPTAGATFGTSDNQSGNRPSLGRKSDEEAMKEGNPTPELPEGVTVESFSNENEANKGMKTDNQAGKRPAFEGSNNQSTERSAFEGGNNQSTDRPTFGTEDNKSGNRPSLGRKSDEEAMKEENPTPELPEGVTMESTGIENMNNSAFGLGGMMEQGFSAGNSSQYFGMNQNARDEQSYNVAEDSGISAYRPAFAGSDNQSTDQPIFEEPDNNQLSERPEFEGADNQSGERPEFGGVDNQSTERPTFGGVDNQSGEQPTFGGADNQSSGRPIFEGSSNQSTDIPTFGTGDNQSGNRPSLGRKSDEEAMKEGNPRPELPEGVTTDDVGVGA